MALQRDTKMVRPDRHAEFSSEIREDLARGGTFAMRLHSAQRGIAQRYSLSRLRGPGCAARGSRRWCGSRGSSSSASLRGRDLSSEACQHPLGDFQFIELGS